MFILRVHKIYFTRIFYSYSSKIFPFSSSVNWIPVILGSVLCYRIKDPKRK